MATKALISLSEAHLASVFVTVVVWCPPGGDCGGPGGRVMGCVWKQARLQAVSLWRPGGQRWGHRGQTSWTRLCLRYADDTTLMAESEDKLKRLLMKVKEKTEKVDLKLNIQKMKIMASGPITSWQIDGKTMETVTDLIFGSKMAAHGYCSH